MIEQVYTIYDSKSEAWLKPFHMRTRGEAIRSFTEVCNDPKSEFCKYPEDYCLYLIGEWDMTLGTYNMHPQKTTIGLASQFKNPDNQLSMLPQLKEQHEQRVN